jgi:hypothetical protein
MGKKKKREPLWLPLFIRENKIRVIRVIRGRKVTRGS